MSSIPIPLIPIPLNNWIPIPLNPNIIDSRYHQYHSNQSSNVIKAPYIIVRTISKIATPTGYTKIAMENENGASIDDKPCDLPVPTFNDHRASAKKNHHQIPSNPGENHHPNPIKSPSNPLGNHHEITTIPSITIAQMAKISPHGLQHYGDALLDEAHGLRDCPEKWPFWKGKLWKKVENIRKDMEKMWKKCGKPGFKGLDSGKKITNNPRLTSQI